MARSRKSSERTSLIRRFRYLIVLVSGGLGVGGWQLKDHPLLQQIFQSVSNANPDEPLLNGGVVKAAVNALEHSAVGHQESFQEPGPYEVKVSSVKLDPALIRSGRTGDIQVRVSKRDAAGHETVVWDSKKTGTPSGEVRRDGATAGWPEEPFRVEWQPGDRFTVDVWQGWGLISTKHFEMKPAPEDTFPLKSGAQVLALVGMDRSLEATDANQIVFDSRPLTTDAAVHRTAAKTEAVGDEDTIVIK